MNLLFLLCILFTLFVPNLMGHEPHPSLKQLIAESKEQNRHQPWSMTSGVYFEPQEVRKKFFGDETVFLREVAALFKDESLYESEGNNRDKVGIWDVHQLLVFLDIDDDSIFEIMRNKFFTLDPLLQQRFCYIFGKHPNKNNIIFLTGILKQTSHPTSLRQSAAYALSYLLTRSTSFTSLDIEQKEIILNTFLVSLNDKTECQDSIGNSYKFGDSIASLMGDFGTSAQPALPIIREMFHSIPDDGCERNDIEHKISLAEAIACIDPASGNSELDYILQKAIHDESRDIRWYAIISLDVPAEIADKVIAVLLKVIQKETNIENKIEAAEMLKKLLEKQEYLPENMDEDLRMLLEE